MQCGRGARCAALPTRLPGCWPPVAAWRLLKTCRQSRSAARALDPQRCTPALAPGLRTRPATRTARASSAVRGNFYAEVQAQGVKAPTYYMTHHACPSDTGTASCRWPANKHSGERPSLPTCEHSQLVPIHRSPVDRAGGVPGGRVLLPAWAVRDWRRERALAAAALLLAQHRRQQLCAHKRPAGRCRRCHP